MHSYCALPTPTSQKPTASLCGVLVGTSQFQRMSPPITLVPPCFWWLDQAWTVQTTGTEETGEVFRRFLGKVVLAVEKRHQEEYGKEWYFPSHCPLMSLDMEPGQCSQLVRRKMLKKMERIHVLNDGPGGEFINSGTTLTTEFAMCKKIHFLCHLSHSEFICMILAAKVTYCLCLSPHKMPLHELEAFPSLDMTSSP